MPDRKLTVAGIHQEQEYKDTETDDLHSPTESPLFCDQTDDGEHQENGDEGRHRDDENLSSPKPADEFGEK